MVSVNPNPVQGFYFCDPMCTGLPGLNNFPPHQTPPPSSSSSSTSTSNSGSTSGSNTMAFRDDVNKIRKPYTITKSRESWTEQEHDKFLEALQLFDRDWKKIEAFVGSKTVIQIRSHAQKYFLKVQKNGTSEHVPPPRPKRRAAHPYPQKAPKHVATQRIRPFQSLPASLEPEYVFRPDSSSVLGNPMTSGIMTSSSYNTMAPVNMAQMTGDDEGLAMHTIAHNFCYSSSNRCTPMIGKNSERNDQRDQESTPRTRQASDVNDPGMLMRVMPDFAQVYSFLGSVFDPYASGHLQRLKQMDPINVETVLLLMRNLCVNLTSPKFEDGRRLIASYNTDAGTTKSGGPHSVGGAGNIQMAVSAPNEVKG